MIRKNLAQALGSASTWALRSVFHRPAENFPGKVGLLADPDLIADLRSKISEGVVVVVGTNGKTTVTNLLAEIFESSGKTVACNRTGANLDSGVASALLHAGAVDWGVFECDELWVAKVAPMLQPHLVVLLNLFRDQLDRMGEIDHAQAAIESAMRSCPGTTLVYNADDPLCQAIAERVENECVPFGIAESLGLAQNSIADADMCQMCDSLLDYDWRQYGQLGSFKCPSCGFARLDPVYAASAVDIRESESEFDLVYPAGRMRVRVPFAEPYMLYNALAVYAATDCCQVGLGSVDESLRSFSPENGRLQRYEIEGMHVLLNLAKNPTGFNQNLRIVKHGAGDKAVAFFVNDKEADGHDVSWLWDVDFQELADVPDLAVFAGGIRGNDVLVRLKYAGVEAELVEGAVDFLAKAQTVSPDAQAFLIANYTALPGVKAELDQLQQQPEELRILTGSPSHSTPARRYAPAPPKGSSDSASVDKLVIVHVYPELLNLYGDGGNVVVLAQRARWRGIEAEIEYARFGQPIDLDRADIVFIGGGPDREQRLASSGLMDQADELRRFVEDDGAMLAICGGFQIIGHTWLIGDETMPGLSILDVETKRAQGGSHNRLVGNVVLESPLAKLPVIGYENHAGRTYLGKSCEPFGHVIGNCGKGNNGEDGFDGARYRNVIGTYLHGPMLAKNPDIADWLLEQALARRAFKQGRNAPLLGMLDDKPEHAANDFMRTKLGV